MCMCVCVCVCGQAHVRRFNCSFVCRFVSIYAYLCQVHGRDSITLWGKCAVGQLMWLKPEALLQPLQHFVTGASDETGQLALGIYQGSGHVRKLSSVKHNYPDHVVKAADVSFWQTGCSCLRGVNVLSLVWFCRRALFCKVLGSRSVTGEVSDLLWFDTVLLGVWFPALGWTVFICLEGVAVREELKMWETACPVTVCYVPIWILHRTTDRTSNLKCSLLCKFEYLSAKKQRWHRTWVHSVLCREGKTLYNRT